VNQRLLILGLVIGLFFALAAISRLIVKADLARDKPLQEVPQAAIRDDLDIRLVTERTPIHADRTLGPYDACSRTFALYPPGAERAKNC
jgi:hypothetical protein